MFSSIRYHAKFGKKNALSSGKGEHEKDFLN